MTNNINTHTYPSNTSMYPSLSEYNPLPSHTDQMIANYRTYASDNQLTICSPTSYRQVQDFSLYPFPVSPGTQNTYGEEDLLPLKSYLDSCLPGFNPWQIDQTHPIHQELLNICQPLCVRTHDFSLQQRISYFNNVIAEIVLSCRSNATLEENLGQKNYSDYCSTTPKFELLEIALRHHLHQGLLFQEQTDIKKFYDLSKKLPVNLDQRENALLGFVTNNNFYHSPYPNMAYYLTGEFLPIALSCIDNVVVEFPLGTALPKYDAFIATQLTSWQLSNPSQCSYMFEAELRGVIAHKIITELATTYRKEFQETGKIKQDQFIKDFNNLWIFATVNGKLSATLDLMGLLIVETFGLTPGAPVSFDVIRANIVHEPPIQPAQPVPIKNTSKTFFPRLPFSFGSSKKPAVPQPPAIDKNTLVNNKLNTIAWIEQQWNQLTQQPQPVINDTVVLNHPLPSAPPESSSENFNAITNSLLESSIVNNSGNLPQAPIIPPPSADPVLPPAIPNLFNADDPNIPRISYVDIAFKDLLQKGNDQEQWNALPEIVRRDILRHVHYPTGIKGKAEELACRIFKNDGWEMMQQIKALNERKLTAPAHGLPEPFVSSGEKLLDFLYSDKIAGQYHTFIKQFTELPKEPRFLLYVYEMAKAANVKIESWNHQFAEYNWNKEGMLPLSIQALERSLHT